MRLAALLLALTALPTAPAPAAAGPPPQFVHAVEFPYYLYPRTLWERELVWLKTIGIRTVEFSIPWNWHEVQPGSFDFTGRTSPRRDLMGFIRILHKAGLQAWIKPLPPVVGWRNNGWPQGASPTPAAQRAWLGELERLLATQAVSHGGPVAWVEGRVLEIGAPAPPAPVTLVSAAAPNALARSREAIAASLPGPRGVLLWTDVEDALYPAGWTSAAGPLLRKGAVGLAGEERVSTAALRRAALLLGSWPAVLPGMRPVIMPKPAAGKLPNGVHAIEFSSPAASAVSITNSGAADFHDELRVREPGTGRPFTIPGVTVPAGETLWLPLGVSIGPDGLCRECTQFSVAENIVYATAELLSLEFENGILALEFTAPRAGEAVLQLARRPVGPYLAAGRLAEFDWDDKTLRARLPIPAGTGPGARVRIGIAIEEPDTSAFFNDPKRLVIGRPNTLSTTYSSVDVAGRSRLLSPDGYLAKAFPLSPNEIDYEVTVPADALHGDWVNFTLEADGLALGRARLQLFRPATIRVQQAMQLHFGSQAELTPDPPVAPVDPRGGTNVEILIRNNSTAIQTYRLEASGQDLEFLPPRTEISVGGLDERGVSLRVFAAAEGASLREGRLRITGGADIDMPLRVLPLPRNRTVAWSADLDGDGAPEWVLESHRARAVFSAQDGGRWLEFTWKDGGVNYLTEQGALAAPGPVEVHIAGDALEFSGNGWKRTVRLSDAALTMEQTTPLPPDQPAPQKIGNVALTVERGSPNRAVYTLK